VRVHRARGVLAQLSPAWVGCSAATGLAACADALRGALSRGAGTLAQRRSVPNGSPGRGLGGAGAVTRCVRCCVARLRAAAALCVCAAAAQCSPASPQCAGVRASSGRHHCAASKLRLASKQGASCVCAAVCSAHAERKLCAAAVQQSFAVLGDMEETEETQVTRFCRANMRRVALTCFIAPPSQSVCCSRPRCACADQASSLDALDDDAGGAGGSRLTVCLCFSPRHTSDRLWAAWGAEPCQNSPSHRL
jgi:hypothetical protein